MVYLNVDLPKIPTPEYLALLEPSLKESWLKELNEFYSKQLQDFLSVNKVTEEMADIRRKMSRVNPYYRNDGTDYQEIFK